MSATTAVVPHAGLYKPKGPVKKPGRRSSSRYDVAPAVKRYLSAPGAKLSAASTKSKAEHKKTAADHKAAALSGPSTRPKTDHRAEHKALHKAEVKPKGHKGSKATDGARQEGVAKLEYNTAGGDPTTSSWDSPVCPRGLYLDKDACVACEDYKPSQGCMDCTPPETCSECAVDGVYLMLVLLWELVQQK